MTGVPLSLIGPGNLACCHRSRSTHVRPQKRAPTFGATGFFAMPVATPFFEQLPRLDCRTLTDMFGTALAAVDLPIQAP